MPEICRFYGIVIRMYPRDHGPAHFHAEYGGMEASVPINDPHGIRGHLPARAQRLVIEWALLRQVELREAWDRASSLAPPGSIAPLE